MCGKLFGCLYVWVLEVRGREAAFQNAVKTQQFCRNYVIGRPRAEGCSPEAEIRGLRSEIGNPKSEIRGPKPEIEGPNSEIGRI